MPRALLPQAGGKVSKGDFEDWVASKLRHRYCRAHGAVCQSVIADFVSMGTRRCFIAAALMRLCESWLLPDSASSAPHMTSPRSIP